jgi:CheY-like chemotaxis protein
MMNLLNLRATDKGLELDVIIDPGIPHFLRGDAGRLRQILNNLMGNAIKFTAKGSITLSLRKEHEDDSGVTVRFLIVDTGIGIPSEKLESIFAPFTQADGSTTRSYGGTGLGLTISRQLAELMGGSIGVASVPGKGSTFWFTATLEKQTLLSTSPLRPESNRVPPTGRGRSDANSPPGGVTRLLLVEDEPTNQKVIATLLTKSGYLVDLANNGREALTALEKKEYTLVLMDCMMPVLNGYEATAAIRDGSSAVRDHLIPVVALTAKVFKDDRALCLAAGMNDYLTKPIDLEDLLAMIKKWIPFGSPSAPLRDHAQGPPFDRAQGSPVGMTSVEVTAEPSDSPLEIFNRDDFLHRNLGDRELSREVAIIFSENAPNYLESLRGALAANDAAGLRQAAHKLKGAAANLSLPSLSEMAWTMEAGAGDPDRGARLLPQLKQKLDQAVEALQNFIDVPEGGTRP